MKRIALQMVCLSVGLLSTAVGAAEDVGTTRIETKLAAPAPELRTASAIPNPPVVSFEMPKWVRQFGLDLEVDSPRVLRFVDSPLVEMRDSLERELSPLAEYADPLHALTTMESSILSSPSWIDIVPREARFLSAGSMTFGTIRVNPVGQFSNR